MTKYIGPLTVRTGGKTRAATWNRNLAVQSSPDFFKQFAAAQALATPAVFPLGVFLADIQTSSDVSNDAAAGLNLYVSLTTDSVLSALAGQTAMHAILQVEDTPGVYPWINSLTANPAQSGADKVVGWNLGDEVDMNDGPITGPSHIVSNVSKIPANDGRFRFINFGKGVAFWETDPQALNFVNHSGIDVLADDLYWFTDDDLFIPSQGVQLLWSDGGGQAPDVRNLSAPEARAGVNYGAIVRRLRRLALPSRPVWTFVELGHPSSDNSRPTITSPQILSAVWHSIIAGATGIVYFNHSFGGAYPTSNILRDPNYTDIRATVTALNQRITSYAPMLNAPTVVGQCSVRTGAARWLHKVYSGQNYLLAGSAGVGSQQITFTVPTGSTATVLDESRSIPIVGGAFTDTFADGNAIHLYRLD